MQLAEVCGEIAMLKRSQSMVAKEQHMMFRQRRIDRFEIRIVERIRQPNSLGRGADAGGQPGK
jgi:hypothetical protein